MNYKECQKNYKALRKNNEINMKMGRRMKGKNSFKKDKMNIRWNEGEDEADYYTNATEIVGVSQTRNSIL